jgi:hypothetical protein
MARRCAGGDGRQRLPSSACSIRPELQPRPRPRPRSELVRQLEREAAQIPAQIGSYQQVSRARVAS